MGNIIITRIRPRCAISSATMWISIPSTKIYSESTNAPTQHSPILAWMADGFPVYGPYGYCIANNATSGIRRMISGYVLRNGQYGTSNLNLTGRTTIPQWAVRLFNVSSNQTGAPFTGNHALGCYMEDNDYLGDHGYVQGTNTFDLDEYNGRWCVTPEFPSGTYAYFVSISSNGAPVFPYNIGRGYYGSPVGGAVTAITETVATNFLGGTNLAGTLNSPAVKTGTVTLTWSAVEGGSYQVEATTNLTAWNTLATAITPNKITGSYTNFSAPDKQFYRVERVLIAGRATWFYLGKLVWPAHLVFIYPRWQVDARDLWQYLFPAGAIGLTAFLWSLGGGGAGRWRHGCSLSERCFRFSVL